MSVADRSYAKRAFSTAWKVGHRSSAALQASRMPSWRAFCIRRSISSTGAAHSESGDQVLELTRAGKFHDCRFVELPCLLQLVDQGQGLTEVAELPRCAGPCPTLRQECPELPPGDRAALQPTDAPARSRLP